MVECNNSGPLSIHILNGLLHCVYIYIYIDKQNSTDVRTDVVAATISYRNNLLSVHLNSSMCMSTHWDGVIPLLDCIQLSFVSLVYMRNDCFPCSLPKSSIVFLFHYIIHKAIDVSIVQYAIDVIWFALFHRLYVFTIPFDAEQSPNRA